MANNLLSAISNNGVSPELIDGFLKNPASVIELVSSIGTVKTKKPTGSVVLLFSGTISNEKYDDIVEIKYYGQQHKAKLLSIIKELQNMLDVWNGQGSDAHLEYEVNSNE